MPHRKLFQPLGDAGLNLQAVFDLAQLPEDMIATLRLSGDERRRWPQLLLLGHAGQRLWRRLGEQGALPGDACHGGAADHPIDNYSRDQLAAWFHQQLPQNSFRLLYPGTRPVALQRLGQLAGWHYDSPFRIGVNRRWGSWFAYRAVALTDTTLSPWASPVGDSPCLHCSSKLCVDACAGGALVDEPGRAAVDREGMDACIAHRLAADSVCGEDCPARRACPVAAEQAYDAAQLRYHYHQSLLTLRRWKAESG